MATPAALTAAGAGSLLEGFGTAVSSLFGGRGKRGASWQDQIGINTLAMREHWQELMNNAKKHGISPLVALGAQPYQPPYQSGTPIGGDSRPDVGGAIANLGQGISRASLVGADNLERRLAELQLKNAELQNDYLTVQIAGAQRRLNNTGLPPAIDIIPHEIISKNPADSGIPAGQPSGFMVYDLGDGQTIELPFSEEGPSEALENLPFPIKQFKTFELYVKRNRAQHDIRTKGFLKSIEHLKSKKPKQRRWYSK